MTVTVTERESNPDLRRRLLSGQLQVTENETERERSERARKREREEKREERERERERERENRTHTHTAGVGDPDGRPRKWRRMRESETDRQSYIYVYVVRVTHAHTHTQPERVTLMDAPEMASDELKRRRTLFSAIALKVSGQKSLVKISLGPKISGQSVRDRPERGRDPRPHSDSVSVF